MSVLVGLPLWAVGRASDLAWFQFGSRKTVRGWKGDEREVGDYALHVQCAWRITMQDKIVTGRGDIFCTPTETSEPTAPDFDWEKGNRFDRVVRELFQDGLHQFLVQSVRVGTAGSLSIALEGDYKLELFPHDSETEEHWRFFRPYSEEPHLVFSGKGLRTE